jgi:predicted PurR-regulated permease PerM
MQAAPSARKIAIGILLALSAGLCTWIAFPYILPLMAGTFLAILGFPMHRWIVGRLRRPSLSALLSLLLMVVIFLVPATLIVMTVVRTVGTTFSGLTQDLVQTELQHVLEKLDGYVDAETVTSRAQEAGVWVLRRSSAALLSAGDSIVGLVIILFTIFFCFRDGERFHKQIVEISPIGSAHTQSLFRDVHQTIRASFYGIGLVAVAQGTMLGIGIWIAGLPAPVLWGSAATFASVIPLLGPSLVWIPAAVMLFLKGKIGMGIFIVIWGAFIVGSIDNYLRPLVVTTALPVNMLVMTVAMLGGVAAFGVLGILIGPVALTVLMSLVRILREENGG